MLNILESIICSEFDKKVCRWQTKNVTPFAMKITFRVSVNYEIEEGFRNISILIYGPMNYVGVFVREDWTVIPVGEVEDEDNLKPWCDYRKGDTGWRMISYHDSCWRDGLHRLLRLNKDRISGLSSFPYWYENMEITPEIMEDLDKCMHRDGDYRYELMKGVLQFERDESGKIIERIHDGTL